MESLGLVAGAGALPLAVAEACLRARRGVFVIRLAGLAAEFAGLPGVDLGMGEMGGAMAALRAAECRQLCFAGHVGRPDVRNLRLDDRGREALPRVLAAARQGDGPLLSCLIAEFEAEGFAVVGAHEAAPELMLMAGGLTRRMPDSEDEGDVRRAMAVTRAMGALDVGQAAVCRGGQVLAVEAQEGTDAMIGRAGGLIGWKEGGERRGVLAKAPKSGQDWRIDLPVIGPGTIRAAALAGLAGVAGEAGAVLLVERDEAVRLADEFGLFVVGWGEGIADAV